MKKTKNPFKNVTPSKVPDPPRAVPRTASAPKSPKAPPAAAPAAAAPAAPAALASDEFAIEAQDATIVQLAEERLQNAQLHAQNRKNERDSLLEQVRTKYQEGGKYVMTSIDIGRGVIERHLAGA
jgi:3-oxoacyl-ACP reductase-like protein